MRVASGGELRFDFVCEIPLFAKAPDGFWGRLVPETVEADGVSGFGKAAERGDGPVVDGVIGEEGGVCAVPCEDRQRGLPVGKAAVVEGEAKDAAAPCCFNGFHAKRAKQDAKGTP